MTFIKITFLALIFLLKISFYEDFSHYLYYHWTDLKIFKIFQSVGNKERSTGIGLSIVKKIIDFYEGKVWLKSSPDKGTKFYFTLKKQL